jgi:hypothetical protein
MEVMIALYKRRWLTLCIGVLFLISAMPVQVAAQQTANEYTIKNGKMFISLNKKIKEPTLDSFIAKYNLFDLGLKQLIKNKFYDSLSKQGWRIDSTDKKIFLISKALKAFHEINNPADKIIFAEKHPTLAERFPAVNNGILYGHNRFRNKFSFAINDSEVTFFLKDNLRAQRVTLAGSFNNWVPNALAMTKTDSGWIALVNLGPGKYWYKFIVDGRWTIDTDNLLTENDGLGNINSVFYKSNVLFILNSFTNARKVYLAGSFNNWQPKDLQMMKTQKGWELPLYLSEGTHTYRFVVDGEWYADPKNDEKFPNEFGDFNSVIRIGKPYLFKLNGYTNAKHVMLAGSFNKWRDDELFMNKTATGWELPYTLGGGNYEYKFKVDGKWITDPANPLTSNTDKNNRNSYVIIEPNYTFRLKGFNNAKNIFLAGDFNDWNPDAFSMIHEGNEWIFKVHLSAGKHLYKFIVDGKWIIDPNNKLWEPNENRTGNSIIWMDK